MDRHSQPVRGTLLMMKHSLITSLRAGCVCVCVWCVCVGGVVVIVVGGIRCLVQSIKCLCISIKSIFPSLPYLQIAFQV